ncbi:MAG: tyrosine-type recombinase/integrase [Xanthomonadales bacterium]|nr:tyrosine-type recombinase/integrase [Xanthomonadales bacterium]
MAVIKDTTIKALKYQNYKGKNKTIPNQWKFGVDVGLYVLMRKNGAKLWQHQYSFKNIDGKNVRRVLSYGAYPDVSLKEAKAKYRANNELVKQGIDPFDERERLEKEKQAKAKAELKRLEQEKIERDRKQKYTFEKMAREWHNTKSPEWSAKHKTEVMSSFQRFAFPVIGKKPIDSIERFDLMELLKDIEQRPNPPLTALRKLRQRLEAVFWYVIDTYKIIDENPAANIKSTSFKKVPEQHLRALPHEELPELMRRIESYKGFMTTKLALKMLVHTFVRHSELRLAQWSEIDWNKRLWTIPESRMKAGKPHVVPISNQVIEILKELQIINGHYPFIFASNHKPHQQAISENAVLVMLKNIGMWQTTTAHGLRSTFSSLANEQQINPDVIERQLAHTAGDKVRAAYNRSEYLPHRIALMQWYSNWIDGKQEPFGQFFESFSKSNTSQLIQVQK